jgi:hypothetical protein
MATLTLTGNAGSLQRLFQSAQAVCTITAENRNISVTLDDSDFSVTYTDGAYGSVKKGHK